MTNRIVIAGLALAAAVAASVWPVTSVDLKWLDLQWRMSSRVEEPSPQRVAIIGIDERSLAAAREPLGLWHRQLAELLVALGDARPKLVALDLVLPDREYESFAPGLDRALARALLTTRDRFPTLLAITVDETREARRIHPVFVAAAGTKPALALWPLDADGVVRRFDERLGAKGEVLETFAGSIVRTAGGNPPPGFIDYSFGKPLGYVSFADVLKAHREGNGEWVRRTFEGRIVLVGSILKFEDAVRVPVPLSGWGIPARETPGVLLNAHAVRSLLAGRSVQAIPPLAGSLLAAALALLLLLRLPGRVDWIIPVAGIAIVGLASIVALRQGTFLPIAWPAAACLAAFAASRGIEVLKGLDERRKLRRSFGGYVSPAVMSEILAGRIRPEGEGTLHEVCALFSDIRNFTTRSERMSPRETIAFVNRYFEGVVSTIHAHGGTVVSFMGDGIMAVFGAPQALSNPCEAAYAAAREMLEGLEALNAELVAEGQEPIAIGIGLHVGPVVAGHVGSRARHDYTAIGDAINVASRLEGATKETGYRIVCSREVAERLAQRAELTPLGMVAIKGHAPVECVGACPFVKEQPATQATGAVDYAGTPRMIEPSKETWT